MILDFNKSDTPREYRTKICVIGSGPVGLTFVSEFLKNSKTQVLVVESGGLKNTPMSESLNQVTNIGDCKSGGSESRARVFGGTSTLWGGQALPLSPLDFEHRDWLKNCQWPFGINELKEYYKRASDILKIDDVGFSQDIWKKSFPFKQKIDNNKFNLTFSKWSPFPDFSRKYSSKIKKSQNVNLLLNASVVELLLSECGRKICSAKLKSNLGIEGSIQADIFILCCGGIENARILLCSNKTFPEGIGNEYRNVGKYFQDHAGFYVGKLTPINFSRFVDLFSSYFRKDQMYLPKLQLSENEQIKSQLLNVTGNVGVQYTSESSIALKRVFNDIKSHSFRRKSAKDIIKVISDPIDSLKLLFTYSVSKRMYYPKNASYFLIANCETEPIRGSCISLRSQQDILGVPHVEINWKITESTRHTLRNYGESIRDELQRLGIAKMIVKNSLYEQGEEWKKGIYSLYHHIGTTRMHDNPRLGVVDAQCKVHGLENLYVGGSSVFPTSGSANPTYTAIALVIRLADNIKRLI